MAIVLFSNNPIMGAIHVPDWECHFFDDSSIEVFKAARDAIHNGWYLLHHPLYGNYRPYQQPFRTMILEKSTLSSQQGSDLRIIPDLMSLQLIEEALLIYHSAHVLTPIDTPAVLRHDCSLLDFELMRLPLQQAGWVEHPLAYSA